MDKMDNLDNSLVLYRARSVRAVLQELTERHVGPVDWFSTYPSDLRFAYEEALGLSIVQMKHLSISNALRYLQGRELSGPDAAGATPRDAAWLCLPPHSELDVFLYIGPPESVAFYNRTLSPRRANYALAYEIGGYLADLLSDYTSWRCPLPDQCETVWDSFFPAPEQHRLWLELRALPRILSPEDDGFSTSTLGIGPEQQYATLHEAAARELLAPWDEVASIYCAGGGSKSRREMVTVLMERFGLPATVAARYCNDLSALLTTGFGSADQSAPPCAPPSNLKGIHWGDEPPDDAI